MPKEKYTPLYTKKKYISFDKEGWAEFPKFKPVPFELVSFQEKNGISKNGWWTGQEWDFLYKKHNPNVIKWKYQNTYGKNNG